VRRHRHAATPFNDRQEVVSATPQHDWTSGRRAADADSATEEPTTCWCGSRRRREPTWRSVAEILDRFFFFLFLVLLLVPTVTILGVVRFFKPEL